MNPKLLIYKGYQVIFTSHREHGAITHVIGSQYQ